MVPTCVGMNRLQAAMLALAVHVPHVCGDEPYSCSERMTLVKMFPTCVGMNRATASATT